jgi:hypothetical protein
MGSNVMGALGSVGEDIVWFYCRVSQRAGISGSVRGRAGVESVHIA